MVSEANNHAFIDEANLYASLKRLDWQLDYGRFRVWLREKYGVTKAYIFLGFVAGKEKHYADLAMTSGISLNSRKTKRHTLASVASVKRPSAGTKSRKAPLHSSLS